VTGWAAEPQITSTVVTSLVALVIGLGGGGGLVALFKVSADRGKIVVEAAQGAVIVQTSVIRDMQANQDRMQHDMDSLRAERDALRAEFAALQGARDAEVADLRSEVARLRADVGM